MRHQTRGAKVGAHRDRAQHSHSQGKRSRLGSPTIHHTRSGAFSSPSPRLTCRVRSFTFWKVSSNILSVRVLFSFRATTCIWVSSVALMWSSSVASKFSPEATPSVLTVHWSLYTLLSSLEHIHRCRNCRRVGDEDVVLPMKNGLLHIGLKPYKAPLVTHPDGLWPILWLLAEELEATLGQMGVADLEAKLFGQGQELLRAPVWRLIIRHGLLPHLPHLLVDHHGKVQPLGNLGGGLHAPSVRRRRDHGEVCLLVQLLHLVSNLLGQLDAIFGERSVEGPRVSLLGLLVVWIYVIQSLAVPKNHDRLIERLFLLPEEAAAASLPLVRTRDKAPRVDVLHRAHHLEKVDGEGGRPASNHKVSS
mmetsp:Transcript_55922/g.143983  ORF Transcript_55922/g.143983 Transcript_55922/m.143983 type:complete len:362 (-) Transcript_55922:7-1092(-)